SAWLEQSSKLKVQIRKLRNPRRLPPRVSCMSRGASTGQRRKRRHPARARGNASGLPRPRRGRCPLPRAQRALRSRESKPGVSSQPFLLKSPGGAKAPPDSAGDVESQVAPPPLGGTASRLPAHRVQQRRSPQPQPRRRKPLPAANPLRQPQITQRILHRP